jgi:glycosyltransferase involved in cell wall biosynthesis
VIVFVNYPFDPRDAEPEALLGRYHTLEGWARAVAEASGAPVAVVQRFRGAATLRRAGVEYRFVDDAPVPRPPPWWWSLRVVDAVAALDPDVVHVHGLVYPAQVRLLRARLPARTTLLVQDHGGIHAGSTGFGRRAWRALHRFGLAAADGFLFSARGLARPWLDAGILGPGHTIHEVAESSTDLAARAPRPGDARATGDPALLWVGRLDRNKDPLTILTAFQQVLDLLPGARLTMVFGEGALLPQVRARVGATPALAGKVELAGPLAQAALPALYASADLFLLGSHHEGSGYALIESLAFGVTPVVTEIPSFSALTAGGTLGALFPPGDAGACARAIVRLAISGASHKQARRQEIAAHFARELSWPALGARAVGIYRTAAKERVRRAGIAMSKSL